MPEFVKTNSITKQVAALKQGLSQFSAEIQNKIVARALRKGLQVIRDGIRSEVPSQYKNIKRTIDVMLARRLGQLFGKVGAGVGAGSRTEPGDSQRSGGLGIDGRNVHWAILGTKTRQHKSGKSTGAMPPILEGIVNRGFEKSKAEAMRAVVDEIQVGIETQREKVHAAVRKVAV